MSRLGVRGDTVGHLMQCKGHHAGHVERVAAERHEFDVACDEIAIRFDQRDYGGRSLAGPYFRRRRERGGNRGRAGDFAARMISRFLPDQLAGRATSPCGTGIIYE